MQQKDYAFKVSPARHAVNETTVFVNSILTSISDVFRFPPEERALKTDELIAGITQEWARIQGEILKYEAEYAENTIEPYVEKIASLEDDIEIMKFIIKLMYHESINK